MTIVVDTVTGEARTYPRSERPTILEIASSLSLVPIAVFTCATVAPGFLLCVPGLLLVVLVISIPLIAVAAVGVLIAFVGAVLATPYLLVRSMRRVRWRGAARDAVTAAERTREIDGREDARHVVALEWDRQSGEALRHPFSHAP